MVKKIIRKDDSPEQKPFTDTQIAQAANDAVRVLQSGPPGRIRSAGPFDGDEILKAPMAWLRENGRYLLPTGAGDAFYAAATGIRNWVALHYVIGTVLLMVLAAVGLLRGWVVNLSSYVKIWEVEALQSSLCADGNSSLVAHIWWSSLFPLSLVPMCLGCLPGIAFWLVHERLDDRKSSRFNPAVAVAFILCLVSLVLSLWLFPDDSTQRYLHRMLFGVSIVVGFAVVVYLCVASCNPLAVDQRVKLTRGLSAMLIVTAVIVVMAVVDTLGQTLYVWVKSTEWRGPVLAPAGLTIALVWLAKRLAANKITLPNWVSKLPVHMLAGIAGIVIFILVGALWNMLVQWIVWAGQLPSTEKSAFLGSGQLWTFFWIAVISCGLSLAVSPFIDFINLSSLHDFYSARLTRAYLGASNGERFPRKQNDPKKPKQSVLSVAEPLLTDNLSVENFYSKKPNELTTFAPLHIINVTVNKTVDPDEQLVQRDRKGQPLAVLPCGFYLDSPGQASPSPFPDSSLSIGQWIGASGAAVSTGLGRQTSLGMSLLMGMANVRLGTWWKSGLGKRTQFKNILGKLLGWIGRLFLTQTYIRYELFARFFGKDRAWQYLSDGGHFENTGIYELLRKERNVRQIFACDNGADPDYRFEDLANLIRLARIDFQVEIEVQTKFEDPILAAVFAGPEAFRRMSLPAGPAADGQPAPLRHTPAASLCGARLFSFNQPAPPDPTPAALLLWVHDKHATVPRTQIILIKPNVPLDAEADVRQYAFDHKTFPQEQTADQFFDQAQWESYRALGSHLGGKIFNADVLQALKDLAAKRMDVSDWPT